jgi:glyoxylase-like metal-dependent hydrolase (beta-lactamase superfamily II)
MQRWQIGDVEITRIIEQEDTSMPPEVMVVEATPENVLPIEWLRPHFIDAGGRLISSIFSLLIETGEEKIVIDTCVGNDKERGVPMWNKRQTSFLQDMADAGFARESVDVVACTHLHQDHVGWNTMLIGGEWVPTFPNARYLFSAKDWTWLEQQPVTFLGDYCSDSVRPIFASGLAELFTPPHHINDEVWLDSTPGHSPGHVSVRISSGGQHAVVTGDLIHHPCQMARPHWHSPFDFDTAQARRTRANFLEQFGDEPVLVIGSHFATPTAGRIVSDGDVYRFET